MGVFLRLSPPDSYRPRPSRRSRFRCLRPVWRFRRRSAGKRDKRRLKNGMDKLLPADPEADEACGRYWGYKWKRRCRI